MIRRLVALSLLLLAAAQAPEPTPPPADSGQDIVVSARTEEEVNRFVRALTQNARGRQIARWNRAICPRAVGLDPDDASFVVHRIEAVARELDIRIGGARCHGNIIVVVAGNADEFTAALLRLHPRLYREPRENLATPDEMARLRRPRPVRWFNASVTASSDGTPILFGINRIESATRLGPPTMENATLAFIIVDANKLQGLAWRQLGDYLALVALARPAMDADYDNSTVLSIFQLRDAGGQGPRQLTPWDRRLLRGLYTTNAATTPNRQRDAIARQMQRAQQPAEAE